MRDYIALFLNNLLPVLLAAGAGYLLSRLLDINHRPISQVCFYIFTPCLIFNLLIESKLEDGDVFRMVLFAIITISLVGILAWVAGKLAHLERRTIAALILTSMFMNAGNFGLSVVLFAFGEASLSHASIYFVTNAIMVNTVGVLIASMGSVNLGKALRNLLKIPTVYALIIALIFMRTGWQIPVPVARAAGLLGDAAIPAMLVLLGLQLKNASVKGKTLPITIATTMRLVVGPMLALALSPIFGISGAARQASVTEAAMPAAVLNTVLSTEFDIEPTFVTTVVFISTLVSPLTLTPLLAYLGA